MVRHAEDELPRLVDVYQLYTDDKLQEFVEAADTLLEHGAPSRHDTIQLLIFLGNCAEDSLDTLNYFQRAQSEYRFWQVNHEYDDIPALEDLAPKLEILRGIVEKERLDWEKEQQEEEARELEALGYNVPDPGLMLDGAADIEEDEGAIDSDTKEASAQAENLAYRPKNKPGKFQASLRIKSLRQQKSKSELRSLSGIFKKGPDQDQRKESEDNDTKKSEGVYIEEERSMGFE